MSEAKLAPGLPQWMQEHAKRYLASNGADGHMFSLAHDPKTMPTLLLTTKGRRSGERYIFPLIYGTAGKAYVVIASKGGAPEHPGWYRNLVAHPEVELQVGDKHLKAQARTAAGEERSRLWAAMAAIFPPYIGYQRKAGREIPVIVLDPV
jgi:proline iminopeptidase